MFAIIYLLGTFIADLLKSRRRLEVENLFLRHRVARTKQAVHIAERSLARLEPGLGRLPNTTIANRNRASQASDEGG
jgi:hypothetical protein